MSETLRWTISGQVAGGPALTASDALSVEVYQKLAIEVPPGATTTVAAAPAGSPVHFLLIKASAYDTLTYNVKGQSAIKLDAPHLWNGEGAIKLLGPDLQALEFKHGDAGGKATTVEILLGRDASPPPASGGPATPGTAPAPAPGSRP